MRWAGMLLPLVCACEVLGGADFTGCLAAVQTAVSQTVAGHPDEAERQLVTIITDSQTDRVCLGFAAGDLAVILQRKGDMKGAERYAKQSVAAFDAAAPDYEPALVRPLQVLAQTYLAQQRFASAKEALARLERLPISSSRDRALQAGARGLIAANEQRWKDAEQEYRLAIGAWETAGEGNAISAVPELTNLALLYLNQRRLTDAEPLLERAWHIVDSAEDAGNEQRITVMTNLGVLYGKQSRWPAAAELLRKAMDIAGTVPEIGTTARRRLYETYAEVLRRCGQKGAAKALQAEADSLFPPDTSSLTVDVKGKRLANLQFKP